MGSVKLHRASEVVRLGVPHIRGTPTVRFVKLSRFTSVTGTCSQSGLRCTTEAGFSAPLRRGTWRR